MAEPRSETPTDEELLNAYFQGEGGAYDAFFKRHFGRIVGFIIKNGIAPSDASDVAQEVFAKLHRSIHLYERGRPALPWFLTIAKNTCYDWRRRHKKFETQTELDENLEATRKDDADARESRVSSMNEKLARLTEEQRVVVLKRVGDELSFKEIGESTGKSEVAARQMFQRALRTLRKLVAGDEQGGQS